MVPFIGMRVNKCSPVTSAQEHIRWLVHPRISLYTLLKWTSVNSLYPSQGTIPSSIVLNSLSSLRQRLPPGMPNLLETTQPDVPPPKRGPKDCTRGCDWETQKPERFAAPYNYDSEKEEARKKDRPSSGPRRKETAPTFPAAGRRCVSWPRIPIVVPVSERIRRCTRRRDEGVGEREVGLTSLGTNAPKRLVQVASGGGGDPWWSSDLFWSGKQPWSRGEGTTGSPSPG